MTNEATKRIERLPLTNDYIFKRVFAQEGNESILKDFLEAILEIKIQKIEVQNPELPKDIMNNKVGILDIKAQINSDIIIDIEMQVENEHNMAERSISYMGKLISNQLQKGEEYKKLKKTILINLLNFNYYKRNSFHSIAHMKFEKAEKESYVDMEFEKDEALVTQIVEMHFIEIPKFIKKNPDTKARINQWLWLLAGKGEKIKMAEKENKELKRAVEVLDEVSMSPEERERYDSILLAEFNRKVSMYNIKQEGKQEGKEEGEKSKSREVAKKLLNKNMTIDEIEEITGLSREEIEDLKE